MKLNGHIPSAPNSIYHFIRCNGNTVNRMIGDGCQGACLHTVFMNVNFKMVSCFDYYFCVWLVMSRRFLCNRNRLSVSEEFDISSGYLQGFLDRKSTRLNSSHVAT